MSTVVGTERRAETVNGARPLPRRRAAPGGRAVVGGLLVAVAAVGTFAAYAGATADHRVAYVVAAHDLEPGHRISRADLSTAPMQLPPAMSARLAFRQPASLVGALVVGPLSAGELVQAGDVAAGPPAAGDRELSFDIKASRAVDGTLAPGDRVDVLATYGSGTDQVTVAVVTGVAVVARTEVSATLGAAGDQTEVITLALPDPGQTLAVTQAVNGGQVMLVRSTGAPPATDGASYRAPGATPSGLGPASPSPLG